MKKTMNKVHGLAGFLWLCCCFQIAAQCTPPTVSVQVQNNGSPLCQVAPVVLLANAGAVTGITYQWKRDGIPIPSGTNSQLFVYEEGHYTVVVTKDNDTLCRTTAPATPLLVTLLPPSAPIVSGTFDGQGNILVSGCGSALVHAASIRGGLLEWYNNATHTGTPLFTGTPYFANTNGNVFVFEKTTAGCYSAGQKVIVSLSAPPTTFAKVPDSLVTGTAIDEFGVTIDTLRLPPFSSTCNLNTARVFPVSGDTILEWHTSRSGPSFDGNGNLISLLATGSSFTWNYSDPLPLSSYPNLEFKKAKVYVYKKVNGCYGPPQPIVITVYRPLAVTATMTPVACKNGTDGSILLGVTGDLAPYHFDWNPVATVNPLNNLVAGTYQYTVTGMQGCTQTGSKVVTEPAQVAITTAKTDITCNGLNNGTVNLTTTGGTPPYIYSWSNGATTQNLTGLSAGTYTVTVRDAFLCTTVSPPSATITQPTVLSVVTNVITNASCGQNNGSISLTVTGGISPYSYSWSDGSTAATALDLAATNYSVTVTDARNCTKILTNITVSSGATISATITPTNASCGLSNGSIALTAVSGGPSTSYTYLWSTGATTQNVTNIGAGSYVVTISSGLCKLIKTTTVSTDSSMSATITPTNASCGLSNGSIALTAVSGGPSTSYTYLWSTGATTQNVTNIGAGSYAVTISSGLCKLIKTTNVLNDSSMSATITPTNASCGLSNGSISLTAVTGGPSTSYTYLWSTGAITQNVTNVGAGSYTVTISSGLCKLIKTTTVLNDSSMSATITPTNASCGLSNGSIALTAVSGGPSTSYTYLWSTGATTQNVTNIGAGSYAVTISSGLCKLIKTTTVSTDSSMSATITPTNASCGLSNGSIALTAVTGGPSTSYTYLWSTGATTQNVTNLGAGSYAVTISSGLCKLIKTTTVLNDSSMSATITPTNASCGLSNGSIALTAVSGGPSTSYTYLWSTGATTQNVTNLGAGSYAVTISSGLCKLIKTTTVSTDSSMSATITPTNASCGLSNGSIALTAVSGGPSTSYTYLWSTGATTQNVTNIGAGSYAVTISSGLCKLIKTTTVSTDSSMSATITPTNASCGLSNGSIALTAVSGGPSTSYTYLWSTGATTQNVTNLGAGSYVVTISSGLCKLIKTTNVSTDSSMSATITPTNASCGGTNGSISLTAVSGGPSTSYTYLWSTGATTQNVTNLGAGSYAVTISSGLCKLIKTTNVSTDSSMSATITPTNASCGLSNGSIALTAVSGGPSTSYTYLWSTGATTQNVTNIGAGSYAVTISSGLCKLIKTTTVSTDSSMSATITPTNASCGLSNGSIALTAVSGGPSTSYTYLWSTGATTQNVTNIGAGSYVVTISSGLCKLIKTTTVSTDSSMSATITPTNASCGLSNGSIALTAVSGGPSTSYTYLWSTGATTQNVTNIGAGSYAVTISSGLCKLIKTTNVSTDSSMSATITPTNASCGGTNGSISLTAVSGGPSTSYTYLWSTGATTQNVTNIGAGSYVVTISSGLCKLIKTTTVSTDSSMSATITPTNASCGLSNGSIALTAVSGGPSTSYTYLWSTGATTQNVTNLGAGSYAVTISSGLCKLIKTTTVLNDSSMSATITPTNASCGGTNGSIALTAVSGGPSTSYTYLWSTGATTQNVTNIGAGSYAVTISSGLCKLIKTTTVSTDSSMSATITPTNASCGLSNGSIALTAVSGGPSTSYTYLWSTGATTQNVTNLGAGSYAVTISSGLCKLIKTTTVSTDSSMSATITPTNASCGLSNGSIALTAVSGGPSTSYTYLWSTGATTQNVTNIGAGSYVVTISSGLCKLIKTTNVSTDSSMSATITPTNASCGLSNGSIALTAVSGGPSTSYTYLWSTGATTQNVTNIGAGSYVVTISSGLCKLIKTTTVSSASNISATTNSLPASCGQNNGSVILSVTGGTSPYSYTWSTGATTISLNNVAAGVYSVTITDANSCSVIKTETVQGSSVLFVTPSATQPSCGLSNGSINLAITGGVAPYTYLWSNGVFTANLTNIGAGTYTILVRDASGCSRTETVVLTQSAGLVVTTINNNASCGQNNGSILTNVSGGIAPYVYLWSSGATTANLTGLAAGTYTVTVTAANACVGTKTTTLIGGESMTLTTTPTNASCNQTDGVINLLVQGGAKPYIYAWSNGASTQNITNLPAGIYTVTVTDAVGCVKTATGSVTQATCGLATDNCAGSELIPLNKNYLYIYQGVPVRVTTTGATPSTTLNPTQKDVWYKFVAKAHAQVFRFTNVAPNTYTGIGMEVYKGTCGSLTSIFYDNNICFDKDNEVFVGGNTATNYLNLNEEYYVRVWTRGDNTTGIFDMHLLRGSLNNICTYAEELNTWHMTVTTSGSTTDPSLTTNSNNDGTTLCENNLAGAPKDDIWFKFTATASTMNLAYNSFFWRKGTCNPDKRLAFSLYDGGCAGSVLPFANNVSFCNKDEADGSINIAGLTSGNRYHLKIWTNGSCNNYAIFNLKINPTNSGSGSSGSYTVDVNQQLPVVIRSLYPVPTDEVLTIQLTSKVAESIKFQFYDARGGLVQTQEQNVQIGTNELHFDISSLPSGVYSVLIPGVVLRNAPTQFIKL
jgi:SprB repeat/Secretion system C-terminal sorting domain